MRLFLLLFITVNLMAFSIDPLLLKAQASIFPKILLLDKDINTKLIDNTLLLNIIHTDNEAKSAQQLKSMIENEYKSNLGELGFTIRLTNIKQFNQKDVASAYYMFDASSREMQKVITYASKVHRICFGYNYKDFDSNILLSLFVKEKTYIYLNKAALINYDIKFIPIFYKIVKVR